MIRVNIAKILWASGNYCGRLDLVITLAHRAIGFKTAVHTLQNKLYNKQKRIVQAKIREQINIYEMKITNDI